MNNISKYIVKDFLNDKKSKSLIEINDFDSLQEYYFEYLKIEDTPFIYESRDLYHNKKERENILVFFPEKNSKVNYSDNNSLMVLNFNNQEITEIKLEGIGHDITTYEKRIHTLKEKYSNKTDNIEKKLTKNIIRQKKNISIDLSPYEIRRLNSPFSGEYSIHLPGRYLKPSDIFPILTLEKEYIKEAIKLEIELLNLKSKNLKEYVDYLNKEQRDFEKNMRSLKTFVKKSEFKFGDVGEKIVFLKCFLENKTYPSNSDLDMLEAISGREESKILTKFSEFIDLIDSNSFISCSDVVNYIYDVSNYEKEFIEEYLKKGVYLGYFELQSREVLVDNIKFQEEFNKKQKDSIFDEDLEYYKKELLDFDKKIGNKNFISEGNSYYMLEENGNEIKSVVVDFLESENYLTHVENKEKFIKLEFDLTVSDYNFS